MISSKSLLLAFFLSILLIVNNGCHVQLVAQYDPAAVNEIIQVYKEIDNFYGDLLNTPPDQRTFQNFRSKVYKIESDISVMYLLNCARPLNTESSKISKNILESWKNHEAEFKKQNSYSDATIIFDRSTFLNNFASMLKAEQAKPASN
ncbi:MAG TPA: hypothetical protein VJ954_03365 [Ignavibacteriaceae bacterium]|nr:hypothetical protein [Ignavibacteriaceae bacterium]